jgi:hypothetical protein
MSLRYKGALLSATPPTVNADGFGSAKGIWTMQQQFQYEGAGTWPSPFTPSYVEDVFSTYLYTGNGAGQTITNGINLSTDGGLVWIKDRTAPNLQLLFDTNRGATYFLRSSGTDAQSQGNATLTSFNTDGFSVGDSSQLSTDPNNIATWSFKKTKKFFDVVTYTGNGSNRTIAHNLGSVPGCIIIKAYSGTDAGSYSWAVYHRSFNASSGGSKNSYAFLNDTSTPSYGTDYWNSTDPTSTVFSLGTNGSVNNSGTTYVAYIFAHDAGGFGDAGTDSAIKCGTFTTSTAVNPTYVTLDWEPQWLLIKRTDSTTYGNWLLVDVMRGMTALPRYANTLSANSTSAESVNSWGIFPTQTGFGWEINLNATFVYIAIRRGPMRTPTDGTKVFKTVSQTSGNPQFKNAGFPVDLAIAKEPAANGGWYWGDRLRGEKYLKTENANAEVDILGYLGLDYSNGAWDDIWSGYNAWMFRRAPGFFDAVAYTGTGAVANITHNLKVAPEFMIVKSREAARSWVVYDAANGNNKFMLLNNTQASGSNSALWNDTTPTSSVFTIGTSTSVNTSGEKFIAYLFASCPGVSKVGSYTGNGSNQTINCGFTAGARFILIKKSSNAGSWRLFDTLRGIVAGNDPSLRLGETIAQESADEIDTNSTGFVVNETNTSNINTNGETYIYLAIA